jgi:hypothetical protein
MPGWPLGEQSLRKYALEALEGVGDANKGQWEEWSGVAYHIRRRLSQEEQLQVGNAKDIRGTPDAENRRKVVQRFLPAHMRKWKE